MTKAATMVVIAAILLPVSAFGYLVTTFLFAFSGGQYRMVQVVNAGALLVVALVTVVAILAWWRSSSNAAIKWTAIAIGIAWPAAIVIEWVLSFALGAS